MGKVIVVPPQIDTTLFRPAEIKWPDLVASVGRLSPEKNIGTLIEAAASLPWPRLWVAGDGPLHVELSKLVASIGNDRIVLLGNVPNDLVAWILSQSEYFVLPSLYDQAPKSLWEAMSAECTCIVSAQVGVVEDGVTGLLCNPTTQGIQVALERARANPQRQRVREAARNYVLAAQIDVGLAMQAEKGVG